MSLGPEESWYSSPAVLRISDRMAGLRRAHWVFGVSVNVQIANMSDSQLSFNISSKVFKETLSDNFHFKLIRMRSPYKCLNFDWERFVYLRSTKVCFKILLEIVWIGYSNIPLF